ncbi:MAG: 5'-nucleotidase, lipoprotein e(P4) family [Bacteroidales bacterium]
MKLRIYSSILFSLLLVSCSTTKKTSISDELPDDKLVMAVAWYQHSAEMAALYYQGFNIARERLDEAVELNKTGNSLAVVVDIDETMLDNSPFETILMNNASFSKSWKDWTAKSAAKPLPGALEFAKYAQSKNVDIFYITNRDDSDRGSTLLNLQKVGFPYSTEDHLFTKSDPSASTGNTSSKAGRRAKVAEKHEIILLIGDNLNDFSEMFEDRKSNGGKVAVARNREDFGRKFIVLPNPMYGAWEKPLFDYREGLSEKEKTQLLRSKLKGE